MAQAAASVEEQTQESQNDSKTQVQSVEFSEAAETQANGTPGSIDILLDMNIPVAVNIGQTEIPVRKLLRLAPGSVIRCLFVSSGPYHHLRSVVRTVFTLPRARSDSRRLEVH